MRMFLVGMCDIFLLLYITTLTNVSPDMVSPLTVGDYFTLKKNHEELKKSEIEAQIALKRLQEAADEEKERADLLKERAERYERLAAKTKAEKESAEKEAKKQQERFAKDKAEALKKAQEAAALAALRLSEAEKARADAAKLKREAHAAKEAAEKEKKKRTERESRLKKVKAKLDAAKEKRKALQAKLKNVSKEKEKTLEQVQSLEEQLAKTEAQADQLREEAQQATAAAEESAEAAKIADKRREEAQFAARVAHAARSAAQSRAEVSARVAREAQVVAAEQERLAEAARIKKIDAERTVQSITQPAEQAYQRNILDRLVQVAIRAESRRLLFGKAQEKIERSLMPVRMGDRYIVVAPLSLLGSLGDDPRDVTNLEVVVSDYPARILYVTKTRPFLLAIEIPPEIVTQDIAGPAETDKLFMPTLIGLRNNGDLGFVDRIRDLETEYFVFSKERLHRKNSRTLIFKSKGIRGTGDFAQRIVSGDQVVDLDGRVVGVATRRNTIRILPPLENWIKLRLTGQSVKETLVTLGTLLEQN
jgi:hypothetical protein